MGTTTQTTISRLLSIIEDEVSREFGVSPIILRSCKRKAHYVTPRHVLWYLTCVLLQMSQNAAAEFFNKRDHTPISYGFRSIQNRLTWDGILKARVIIIRVRCEKRIKEAVRSLLEEIEK